MRTVRLKVLLAGLLAACACGGLAIGVAWATSGAGVTSALLSGPVALDEIGIVSQNETHGVILKTRGEWETRVVHFRVTPGGYFGWHTHPGPVFVMVTAGTLTYYDSDDPTNGVDYGAGTGFVDQGGGHVHDARNEGDIDVELVAFFLTPQGTPIRIDAPQP